MKNRVHLLIFLITLPQFSICKGEAVRFEIMFHNSNLKRDAMSDYKEFPRLTSANNTQPTGY